MCVARTSRLWLHANRSLTCHCGQTRIHDDYSTVTRDAGSGVFLLACHACAKISQVLPTALKTLSDVQKDVVQQLLRIVPHACGEHRLQKLAAAAFVRTSAGKYTWAQSAQHNIGVKRCF